MVVIITLQTKIGQAEGLINLCIPYLVLESIMSKLTTTFWVSSSVAKQASPEHNNALQRKLEKTLVPVVIELGRTSITVQELLELTVGDVMQLETGVEQELSVTIGQKEKFKCKPGLSGHKLAVQITQITSEGDDNDE
jgi:flagellar motor switch protein FliM